MAQNGRLINQESTWELNLTVLQRIDQHVEDILITAGHVTLYEFDVDKCQWSRKDVEGSLFVVKRRTKPRFQFIVMNRRSTENLVEDLLDDFEYEVQTPYLLYHNASQEVNGIWFYNPRECEEVANLFSRIMNAYSKNPPKHKAFSPQGDEFQELEAVPNPATVDGPLEPQSVPSASNVSEDNLERIFTNAMHLNSNETVPAMGTTIHPFPVQPAGSGNVFSPVGAMPPPPPPPTSTSPPSIPLVETKGNSSTLEPPSKPAYFVPPPIPTSQSIALHPPPALQPSIGAPLLQPFPPPAPSSSLTPNATLPNKPVVSRDSVRDALYRLVQNERFIDMVYEEILKSNKS